MSPNYYRRSLVERNARTALHALTIAAFLALAVFPLDTTTATPPAPQSQLPSLLPLDPRQPEFAPGVVLVKFKPEAATRFLGGELTTTDSKLNALFTHLGVKVSKPVFSTAQSKVAGQLTAGASQSDLARWYRLELPAEAGIEDAVRALGVNSAVEVAEPDYVARAAQATDTSTPTDTETGTATATETPTETATATDTPTETALPTATDTPTDTPTATDTPSATPSPTASATSTETALPTATDTPTDTPTATDTPSATPSPTASATPTQTPTPTATRTPSATPTPTATPYVNDPLYSQQWALTKIQIEGAWDNTRGSPTVIIAFVDSGIDLTHPDLASRLWTNLGEIAGNGLDDDSNGLVDDVNGWNFVFSNNDVSDDNGHGTLVAGIAAAANNGQGIVGVCPQCRIMPVKVMQASGIANYSDIAAGVSYAAQKGAKVINLSLGGYADAAILRDAINTAVNTYGVVVVGGSGNDNLNQLFYPAAYDNVLGVAGTTITDTKAVFADYGPWVDVAAPGVNIKTTALGGDWLDSSGTSLSAPFASGLAGLLRSLHPDWSQSLVRSQIVQTAADIDALNPGYAGLLGSGRINAGAAMQSPHPILTFVGYSVNGEANGRPDPGGGAAIIVTLGNSWLDAFGVTGTLSTTDPLVTITTGTASFGDVAAGATIANTTPFSLTVASGAGYSHPIPLTLTVNDDTGYSTVLNFTVTTRSAEEPVSGTIAVDTLWTNDKTYIVIANIGIAPGATLTIQPGTTVKFTGNYSLSVGGTLLADGTVTQPIQFKLNTTGMWNQINFSDSSVDAQADGSGNYISGNILRYMTIQSSSGGIVCNSATLYLSHVTSNSGGVNCTLGSTSLWLLDNSLTGGVNVTGSANAQRNTISNGGLTISGAATLMNNAVTGGGISIGSGNPQGNAITGGGLSVGGSGGTVTGNAVSGGSISVGDSFTLTDNTVTGGRIVAGNSALVTGNTLSGNGITVGSSSTVTGNSVENAEGVGLQAGGSVTATGNRFVGNGTGIIASTGAISGNLIANTTGVGLQVGAATVTDNTLTGNKGNTILVQGAAPVKIENNNLEGNSGPYDLYIDIPWGQFYVLAQRNWWGTTSTATIASRIFDFNDDFTKAAVTYAPTLTAPEQAAPAYVRSVTVSPATTLGIQTGTFTVQFSRPMDTNYGTDLSFSYGSMWSYRASMPTLRAGLGVAAATNGKIYAIGGQQPGGQFGLTTVEEYDPATNTWQTRASLPYGLTFPGVVGANNGKIYVIGGDHAWGQGLHQNTVYEFDPATNTWTRRADMPTARSGLGAAQASNGKIYAIGGYGTVNDSRSITVEEYDPATDTWRTRASMPTGRGYLGVVAANNGKVYAIGGGFGEGGALATVEEYDPATDTWASRSNMPTARTGLALAAASNGKIYAIGGSLTVLYGQASYTVEEYDPATDTWATRADLGTYRISPGAAASNGKIYVMGDYFTTTVEEAILPFEASDFFGEQWLSSTQFRASYDITSMVPKNIYVLTVSGAVGTDSLVIAPNSNCTFTVDYAGFISDTTPPIMGPVTASSDGSLTTISASWSATDPESTITQYRYAIGTTPGGRDVVNWTYLSGTLVTRIGLNLIQGQTYYVTAGARNEGGLWSENGVSNGVVAGVAPSATPTNTATTTNTATPTNTPTNTSTPTPTNTPTRTPTPTNTSTPTPTNTPTRTPTPTNTSALTPTNTPTRTPTPTNTLCYTLTKTVNPAGSGKLSASPTPNCNSGTQYTYGTVVQLTASANAGYAFANWSGDANGSSSAVSVTMTSDKSVTANFIPLAPPGLLSSYNVHPPQTLRPLFDWTTVSGATSYNIQIATSSTFTAPIVNINVSPSAYVPTTDLPRGVTLYWRVRANGPYGPGNWSAAGAFSSPNPPGTPSLLSPASGALVTGLTPMLDWSDSTFAPDHYDVQISTASDFSAFAGQGVGGAAYESRYTVEQPLAPNTTYYWRVRAIGGSSAGGLAMSEWSAVRTFRTPP